MATISEVNGIPVGHIAEINEISSIDDINFIQAGGEPMQPATNTYSFAVGNVLAVEAGTGTYLMSSYMSASNPDSYHFRSGGDDEAFSVSVWFNFPAPGGGAPGASHAKIISKGTNSDREWDLSFYGSNATVLWRLNTDSSNRIYLFDGVWSHLTESWHHIAATYDGSEAKEGLNYYIDGELQNQDDRMDGTYAGLNDSGEAVTVGAFLGASNPQCFGYFDEVSIWTKELSSAEVAKIYNGGTPTNLSSQPSLLSWWRMGDSDGGTGITVTDAAPAATGNGTLTGSVSSGLLPADGFTTGSVPTGSVS